MATIVYLDPDDEITSAATRIRTADGVRVGLVLPFGSRVATSRINFRLLAREAQANGRRLDIVAPDASARALAASAGLPVFGSVAEYEAALDGGLDGGRGRPCDRTAAARDRRATGAQPRPRRRWPPSPRSRPSGPEVARPLPAVRGRLVRCRSVRGRGRPGARRGRGDGRRSSRRSSTRSCGAAARSPWRSRVAARPAAGAIVAILVLVLAVVVGGVAAAFVLPSAEITVTPRIDARGPGLPDRHRGPGRRRPWTRRASSSRRRRSRSPWRSRATSRPPASGSRRRGPPAASAGRTATRAPPTPSRRGPSSGRPAARPSPPTRSVFLPVAGLSGNPPNVSVKCTTSEVAVTAVEAGRGRQRGGR